MIEKKYKTLEEFFAACRWSYKFIFDDRNETPNLFEFSHEKKHVGSYDVDRNQTYLNSDVIGKWCDEYNSPNDQTLQARIKKIFLCEYGLKNVYTYYYPDFWR